MGWTGTTPLWDPLPTPISCVRERLLSFPGPITTQHRPKPPFSKICSSQDLSISKKRLQWQVTSTRSTIANSFKCLKKSSFPRCHYKRSQKPFLRPRKRSASTHLNTGPIQGEEQPKQAANKFLKRAYQKVNQKRLLRKEAVKSKKMRTTLAEQTRKSKSLDKITRKLNPRTPPPPKKRGYETK